MSALSNILDQMKAEKWTQPGERLFYYARNVRGVSEIKPLQSGDCFRASSLYKLCPREEVLANRYDIIRTWHKDPGLQITLDIGTAFHKLYRDLYFGPMGEWMGSWKCMRCDWNTDIAGLSSPPKSNNGCVKRPRLAKMPKECGKCGAPFIVGSDFGEVSYGTFNEWEVEDKGIGLSGHPDGWYKQFDCDARLCDLKSHSANGFTSRKKLRNGHDLQVIGYWYMCDGGDSEVWYLNKSPWGDHSSFLRTIPVSLSKDILREKIIKPLNEIQEGLAGGKFPDMICTDYNKGLACDCQMKEICFNC